MTKGQTDPTDHAGEAFTRLLTIMAALRAEDGCPWDREQTHASLKPYLLEETYELLDAIDGGDDAAFVDELGDVLLQVVFHAQIASETGRFDMGDVLRGLADKLVRRHPHVFGDERAETPEAVVRTWEAVKRKERAKEEPASLLGSVPKALPALMEAKKVQQRAARVGFEWDDIAGAWDKVHEELAELQRAAIRMEKNRSADAPPEGTDQGHSSPIDGDLASLRQAVADELGDVLFAVVNVARYLDVDPEQSLRAANAKFRRRFTYIEEQARSQGRRLEDMDLAEMDALWDEAKRVQERRG